MEIEQPIVVDLLETPGGAPALSSTSDMPVVEAKPDVVVEVPAAAPEEEAEQLEESATSTTEETKVSEQSGEPAKKESRGVQKALDRLTAEREEQKRRAEAAEERERALFGLAAEVVPEYISRACVEEVRQYYRAKAQCERRAIIRWQREHREEYEDEMAANHIQEIQERER